jgi:ATP-dependent Lhr-like helicase
LLDCYGVVTARGVRTSGRAIPGGFSAIYREMSRQEELGGVRRGYFVEGMGGAQFAMAEAVDRLRAVRELARNVPPVIVLRATDPAQPYGTIVPWPERDDLPQQSRTATQYVALRDGELVATFSPSGKSLTLYVPDALPAVAHALTTMIERRRIDRIAIDTINGEQPTPEHVIAFAGTAFVRTPRGVRATRASLPGATRFQNRARPDYVEHSDVALPTHGASTSGGQP